MQRIEKLPKQLAPSSRTPPCPFMPLSIDRPQNVSMPKGDLIKFGMNVSTQEGCCIKKLKTGSMEGCCSHISTEKHLEHFKNAVKEELEETGIPPKLDDHTKAILDGKIKPGDPFEVVESKPIQSPQEIEAEKKQKELKAARAKEPLLLRIVYAPFRFIKWLFIGFWKDMKQLLTGQKVD